MNYSDPGTMVLRLSHLILLLLPFLGALHWALPQAWAAPREATVAPVTPDELNRSIEERITRVPEFALLRKEAAKLGVRVWLFGGTAAGFGHYVNADLKREHGDQHFQSDRFDYDFTNIYRASQDADIVVDGTPEQAAELQAFLKSCCSYLQGSKDAWEVRTLRVDLNPEKMALLNNPDFLDQHTDSNSTGLIEITRPPAGESAVRDLKSWNDKGESIFARDLREGRVSYLFSDQHFTTARAKAGKNPPILSAIRTLIKAFQFDLEISPDTEAELKKVIQDFDPKSVEPESYVAGWIEQNGKKLMTSAVDMESAWNRLESLGLRKKLMAIRGDAATENTLAWWMNKEPLRSKPVGQGSGKTARELGLSRLAHGTSDYTAYESITMSRRGDPNILISRPDVAGEVAAFGKGLYTRPGDHGAGHTNFTIHFELDPNAREGSDFEQVESGILVHNKKAIRVLPETLNLGPVEWFEMVSAGKTFKADQLGIQERLRRRVQNRAHHLTDEEDQKISAIVMDHLRSPRETTRAVLLAMDQLPKPLTQLKLAPEDHVLLEMAREAANNRRDAAPILNSIREHLGGIQSPSAVEVVLQGMKGMRSESLLNAVAEISKENPHFTIDNWLELLLESDDIHAAWTPEFIRRFGALSPTEQARVARKALELALKSENPQALLKAWISLEESHPHWSAKDWLQVFGRKQAMETLSSFGVKEKLASLIDQSTRSLSSEEEREALRAAEKALSKPGVSGKFGSLWLSLSLSERHPETSERMLKAVDPEVISILSEIERPNRRLWKEMIQNTPKKYAADLKKTFFDRITFGQPPINSEAKKAFYVPIVRKLYEAGERKAIGNLAYDFREPWTKDWGDVLTEVIEEIARHKDKANLKHLAYYLGIFDEAQIGAWEKQAKLLITRAAELGDRATLKEAANLVSGKTTFAPKNPRNFPGAISLLIQKAKELKDVPTLEAVAETAFKGKLALAHEKQLRELIAAADQLGSREILHSLASSLTTAVYSNERDGRAFEGTMRDLLDRAIRSRDSEMLTEMVWNLSKKDYPDDFFARFIDAAVKLNAKEALSRVVGISGWFDGYDQKDVKSTKLLMKAMDAGFTLKDPELISGAIVYGVLDRPGKIKKMQLPALEHGVEELLKFGASPDPADRKLYRAALSKIRDRVRGTDFGQFLEAQDATRFREIEALLKTNDPALSLEWLSSCPAKFGQIAHTR